MVNISNVSINKIDSDTEAERMYNEIADAFVEGFISSMFSQDIVKTVTVQQITEYLSNPDNYIRELEKVATFYYISDGNVFQLFDLARVLPTLNYKIDIIDNVKNQDKYLNVCNRILKKVKHRQLTRDIISQEISSGTVVGIWLGDKKNPYFYIFDDLKLAYPAYRVNGDWQAVVDLSILSEYTEQYREVFFRNLTPYVTEQMYNNYLSDSTMNIVELPQERTVCLRTHALKRSQAYGVNWSTSGLFSLSHKKKLQDLEKAIANKIITSIAVLKIGSEENPELGNLRLNPSLKKKIHARVKQALEKNEAKGISVITLPEFANLSFPELKSDALEPDKFKTIDNDITSAYGTSPALVNGTGANFASAKINLDIFYKRLGVLLEDIETEVYGKLFKLVLPASVSDDFSMCYDKEAPLTLKEKLDVLQKLHTEGYAVKPIVDALNGIDYNEYINQSIYEIETLKLREKLIPPKTSSTLSKDDSVGGAPSIDDNNLENNNTVVSKSNDGNSLPE